MKKIILSQRVLDIVELYTRRYRLYHQELFQDSGIYDSKKIISLYQKESINRYEEILLGIEKTLCQSIISYKNNRATIRWRTKILMVQFKDTENTRIITDLEIK